ncbi:sensor histidine kinase [Cognatishimia sp. F0-27]|uniref:sensor histidine kinase n=1 Tax=Cognatishimia sp. F0-27 TaxID=2816855 RepID=UPI001D0C43D3|nr:histidine kinase dimerization/phosphoacceptor domain -containing protein [Cognatishimia sp. F0-27]MCC1491810.1 GAF domain-containing protein [Cognatishimia sp. F0-27]
MRASIPQDQERRLAELNAYHILDTDGEESFDEIVELVRRLLDVPVVLISLVDSDRQWFKASVGVDISETPIEQSICAHAILGDGLLEIEDTLDDPRTCDNPLVNGPLVQMRYYAGAPLMTPSGRKLGTLCVLDTEPRKLTEDERATLRVMASQVMHQLELRRTLANEVALRAEIDHRVKNSLQSVASFLRLYRSAAQSEETRSVLNAALVRVSAVSDLHEALYRNDAVHAVDMADFLSNSMRLLQSQAPESVRLEADIAPIVAPAALANALALILAEFTANSFKHAFPNGGPGVVRLELDREGPGLVMTCSDTGKPTKSPPAPSTGIGMRIMEAAAEQIEGQLEMGSSADGYRLRLHVPVVPEMPSSADPEPEADSTRVAVCE